jgi:peptidoglycan/LPS O-acetylase OafA/YrhL
MKNWTVSDTFSKLSGEFRFVLNDTRIDSGAVAQIRPNWALLGGMRFALAAIVLGAHLVFMQPEHLLVKIAHWLNQFSAVAAFLMISGFSMADSYAARPQGFYERRINRIYPVYIVCFIFALVPFVVGGPLLNGAGGHIAEAPGILEFVGNAFLLQPVFVRPMLTIGQNWSLGVEALFYLLTPLFARLNPRAFFAVLLGSAMLYALHGTGRLPGIWAPWAGPGTPFYFVWFFLVGWALRFHNGQIAAFGVAAAAGLFAANQQSVAPPAGGGLIVAATGFVLIMNQNFQLSPRCARVADYLGDLSYPLYMVHYPLIWLLVACKAPPNVWLCIVVALIGSVVVLHGVDYPYRARIRRSKNVPIT